MDQDRKHGEEHSSTPVGSCDMHQQCKYELLYDEALCQVESLQRQVRHLRSELRSQEQRNTRALQEQHQQDVQRSESLDAKDQEIAQLRNRLEVLEGGNETSEAERTENDSKQPPVMLFNSQQAHHGEDDSDDKAVGSTSDVLTGFSDEVGDDSQDVEGPGKPGGGSDTASTNGDVSKDIVAQLHSSYQMSGLGEAGQRLVIDRADVSSSEADAAVKEQAPIVDGEEAVPVNASENGSTSANQKHDVREHASSVKAASASAISVLHVADSVLYDENVKDYEELPDDDDNHQDSEDTDADKLSNFAEPGSDLKRVQSSDEGGDMYDLYGDIPDSKPIRNSESAQGKVISEKEISLAMPGEFLLLDEFTEGNLAGQEAQSDTKPDINSASSKKEKKPSQAEASGQSQKESSRSERKQLETSPWRKEKQEKSRDVPKRVLDSTQCADTSGKEKYQVTDSRHSQRDRDGSHKDREKKYLQDGHQRDKRKYGLEESDIDRHASKRRRESISSPLSDKMGSSKTSGSNRYYDERDVLPRESKSGSRVTENPRDLHRYDRYDDRWRDHKERRRRDSDHVYEKYRSSHTSSSSTSRHEVHSEGSSSRNSSMMDRNRERERPRSAVYSRNEASPQQRKLDAKKGKESRGESDGHIETTVDAAKQHKTDGRHRSRKSLAEGDAGDVSSKDSKKKPDKTGRKKDTGCDKNIRKPPSPPKNENSTKRAEVKENVSSSASSVRKDKQSSQKDMAKHGLSPLERMQAYTKLAESRDLESVKSRRELHRAALKSAAVADRQKKVDSQAPGVGASVSESQMSGIENVPEEKQEKRDLSQPDSSSCTADGEKSKLHPAQNDDDLSGIAAGQKEESCYQKIQLQEHSDVSVSSQGLQAVEKEPPEPAASGTSKTEKCPAQTTSEIKGSSSVKPAVVDSTVKNIMDTLLLGVSGTSRPTGTSQAPMSTLLGSTNTPTTTTTMRLLVSPSTCLNPNPVNASSSNEGLDTRNDKVPPAISSSTLLETLTRITNLPKPVSDPDNPVLYSQRHLEESNTVCSDSRNIAIPPTQKDNSTSEESSSMTEGKGAAVGSPSSHSVSAQPVNSWKTLLLHKKKWIDRPSLSLPIQSSSLTQDSTANDNSVSEADNADCSSSQGKADMNSNAVIGPAGKFTDSLPPRELHEEYDPQDPGINVTYPQNSSLQPKGKSDAEQRHSDNFVQRKQCMDGKTHGCGPQQQFQQRKPFQAKHFCSPEVCPAVRSPGQWGNQSHPAAGGFAGFPSSIQPPCFPVDITVPPPPIPQGHIAPPYLQHPMAIPVVVNPSGPVHAGQKSTDVSTNQDNLDMEKLLSIVKQASALSSGKESSTSTSVASPPAVTTQARGVKDSTSIVSSVRSSMRRSSSTKNEVPPRRTSIDSRSHVYPGKLETRRSSEDNMCIKVPSKDSFALPSADEIANSIMSIANKAGKTSTVEADEAEVKPPTPRVVDTLVLPAGMRIKRKRESAEEAKHGILKKGKSSEHAECSSKTANTASHSPAIAKISTRSKSSAHSESIINVKENSAVKIYVQEKSKNPSDKLGVSRRTCTVDRAGEKSRPSRGTGRKQSPKRESREDEDKHLTTEKGLQKNTESNQVNMVKSRKCKALAGENVVGQQDKQKIRQKDVQQREHSGSAESNRIKGKTAEKKKRTSTTTGEKHVQQESNNVACFSEDTNFRWEKGRKCSKAERDRVKYGIVGNKQRLAEECSQEQRMDVEDMKAIPKSSSHAKDETYGVTLASETCENKEDAMTLDETDEKHTDCISDGSKCTASDEIATAVQDYVQPSSYIEHLRYQVAVEDISEDSLSLPASPAVLGGRGHVTDVVEMAEADTGMLAGPTEAVEPNADVIAVPTEAAESDTGMTEVPTEAVESDTGMTEMPTEAVESDTGMTEMPTEAVESDTGMTAVPTEGVKPDTGKIAVPTETETAGMMVSGETTATETDGMKVSAEANIVLLTMETDKDEVQPCTGGDPDMDENRVVPKTGTMELCTEERNVSVSEQTECMISEQTDKATIQDQQNATSELCAAAYELEKHKMKSSETGRNGTEVSGSSALVVEKLETSDSQSTATAQQCMTLITDQIVREEHVGNSDLQGDCAVTTDNLGMATSHPAKPGEDMQNDSDVEIDILGSSSPEVAVETISIVLDSESTQATSSENASMEEHSQSDSECAGSSSSEWSGHSDTDCSVNESDDMGMNDDSSSCSNVTIVDIENSSDHDISDVARNNTGDLAESGSEQPKVSESEDKSCAENNEKSNAGGEETLSELGDHSEHDDSVSSVETVQEEGNEQGSNCDESDVEHHEDNLSDSDVECRASDDSHSANDHGCDGNGATPHDISTEDPGAKSHHNDTDKQMKDISCDAEDASKNIHSDAMSDENNSHIGLSDCESLNKGENQADHGGNDNHQSYDELSLDLVLSDSDSPDSDLDSPKGATNEVEMYQEEAVSDLNDLAPVNATCDSDGSKKQAAGDLTTYQSDNDSHKAVDVLDIHLPPGADFDDTNMSAPETPAKASSCANNHNDSAGAGLEEGEILEEKKVDKLKASRGERYEKRRTSQRTSERDRSKENKRSSTRSSLSGHDTRSQRSVGRPRSRSSSARGQTSYRSTSARSPRRHISLGAAPTRSSPRKKATSQNTSRYGDRHDETRHRSILQERSKSSRKRQSTRSPVRSRSRRR